MNKQRMLKWGTAGFIGLCALSLLSVSLMAFSNPQSVMDLVSVTLNNTDAYSSIRGVYGGAGMAMVLLLVYLIRHDRQIALLFLSLLWGLYALSRLITIFAEGPLGDFGLKWIVTETVLCIIAVVLFVLNRKPASQHD
ncbi:MAG: DUF4345 domain-containing protein [Bacteroidota bacterium]